MVSPRGEGAGWLSYVSVTSSGLMLLWHVNMVGAATHLRVQSIHAAHERCKVFALPRRYSAPMIMPCAVLRPMRHRCPDHRRTTSPSLCIDIRMPHGCIGAASSVCHSSVSKPRRPDNFYQSHQTSRSSCR